MNGTATEEDAKKIIHHKLYVRLQQLVCVYLHTISPPVRVAITRYLQFKSTFVKLRADPSRYCIHFKLLLISTQGQGMCNLEGTLKSVHNLND